MPKAEISMAQRDTVAELARKYQLSGVAVPKRSNAKKCAWKPRKGDVWLPFDVLCDIADFSLHNAIVRIGSHLLHQELGIPMGDPISPGMTIGTCAWMEKEWMNTLASRDKLQFCAGRFMDDILMLYRKSPNWDYERFLADFARSECYHPPLELEDAKDDTFLETTFKIEGGYVRHWLKNENPRGGPTKVWRYHHFASYCSYEQKRATLMACMKKVHTMASDAGVLHVSALQKLKEFHQLCYPIAVMRGVCTYMAACTHEYEWIKIRDVVISW